jgi:hypothetical protein
MHKNKKQVARNLSINLYNIADVIDSWNDVLYLFMNNEISEKIDWNIKYIQNVAKNISNK